MLIYLSFSYGFLLPISSLHPLRVFNKVANSNNKTEQVQHNIQSARKHTFSLIFFKKKYIFKLIFEINRIFARLSSTDKTGKQYLCNTLLQQLKQHDMKVCRFCKRPITAGHYKTPLGNIYCCDCYMSKLSKFNISAWPLIDAQSTRDDLIKALENSVLSLITRINQNSCTIIGNLNDSSDYIVRSKYGNADMTQTQDHINRLKKIFKLDKDFLEAQYFDSKEKE